jgi:hypothetical protein
MLQILTRQLIMADRDVISLSIHHNNMESSSRQITDIETAMIDIYVDNHNSCFILILAPINS